MLIIIMKFHKHYIEKYISRVKIKIFIFTNDISKIGLLELGFPKLEIGKKNNYLFYYL